MYKNYKSVNIFSEVNILITVSTILNHVSICHIMKWDTYNEKKIVNLYPCCSSFTTIFSLKKKKKRKTVRKLENIQNVWKKYFFNNISMLYVRLSALKYSRAAHIYTEKRIDTKFCSLG